MNLKPFLLLALASTLVSCSKQVETAPPPPANPPAAAAPAPAATPVSTPVSAPAPAATISNVVATPPPAPAAPAAPPQSSMPVSLADLSSDQVARGLKEALGKGLGHAVQSLGHSGGFLTNLDVKIPMPQELQTVEKTLRKLGQDRLADDFITTMNQAAEQAVPAAADVFTSSLGQMTVENAKAILSGPDDAATQFFRKATGDQLKQKFRPIVAQATAKSGATAAYKQVMDKAQIVSPFLNTPSVDLDGYVTDKAMDGLFKMVAAEEKRIRDNPVARNTDLLKSVFGALQK